ncbi:MAG TPA: TonB-dependent receptor [Bryobacteraceae bacterium]|nr:TonB-dependent receptor [Bryobacteraceae bacterium]
MRFQSRLAVVGTVLIACFSHAAFGQTAGAGTITGTLTDQQSAVVPEASVVIHNTDTGVDRTVASNGAGLYYVTFLQPGHYQITATKPGFAKVVRKDLLLQVGQTLTIDIQMPLQTTQETVTVAGEEPLVDTEKTELSQVVSTGQVENLPIAGRRWETFALLTPNVTNDGGTGLASYRGISALYNSSAVDGANNNQAFFSEAKGRTTVPYVYSMDSIQEFQVTASNYSAELGQAAGGVINAVTKSGTNLIHGDLFYYLRYPTLNALDPIQKAAGIYTQPIHQQQQFGGSVGGPLIKDKLFYFLTYDGSRKVNPISYTSSAKFPLSCPGTIPAATCLAANNFFSSQLGAFPRFADQDVAFGKIDYQLNNKNHINSSFNWDNFHSPNSYNTAITAANNSLTANGTAVTHERTFVTSWDSTISNTMINNLRFQWSRDLEIISANGTAPSVTVSNVMAYGMPNALPRPAFPDEHRDQISDVFTSTHGTHTFKAGVDVNAIHELLINLFQGGGVYTYSGTNAFPNWVADVTGTNLGDNLTGRHFTTFVQVNDPITHVGKDDFYDNDFDAFFEDTWKVTPKLTLNLGVRYDLQLIPQPAKPNVATPLTTLYTSTINIDKNNFAPRIGLAWSLGKGTVLRAGYGMFYAKTSNSTFYATRVENGVFQQTFNCNTTTCPALTFPNLPFTPPGGAPIAPFSGALTPQVTPFTLSAATATTRGQVPDWVNPLVHEGEVNFERAIPGSMTASISYVFSRALRLPMFVDTNLQPATATKAYDITNTAGATQSTVTEPFYTTRIDPTGSILTGFSDVNSWYNSMVLSLRRPMSHGLEFMVNYTLAKATDGGQVPGQFGTFNGTDSAFDPKNRKLEYARSDLDQRHRFVGNVVWAPPYAKKLSNTAMRLLLDGWNFSTIVVASTGQAVTGVINGFPSGGPDGGLTGGLVNNSGTGTGGRAPGVRNSFTGPGYKDVDFRIGRQFAIAERYRLSFVGEAFNLFNFTNIYTVNNTEYNYSAAGSGVCAGHTNGCLVANPAFFAPLTSNNNLSGARQLQISARFTF